MRPSPWVLVMGAVVGACAGLGLGALAHVLAAAGLDAVGGGWRDLQGFAWNLVPLGTVAGGVLGGWAADRWQRRRTPGGTP